MRTTWLLLLASMLVLNACGDDGGSEDGGLSGDGDGDGDGGMTGDGDGDGDGDGSCDGPNGREVLAPTDELIAHVRAAGDSVVFVARAGSLLGPTSIDVVGSDGEGREAIYTSSGQRRVVSIAIDGSDVLFLEENEEIVSGFELFRLPLAGGEPERIDAEPFGEGEIIGADDTHAYLVINSGARFERIDLESGERSPVGSVDGVGTPLQVSLSGDAIFFYAGATNGSSRDVYTLATDAEDEAATSLWSIESPDVCNFPLGGMLATPTKVACGFSGVGVRARDGSMPETLIEPDVVNERNHLVATDGEDLYLIEPNSLDGEEKVRMKRMSSSGGAREAIVCDLGAVATRTRFGFFPDQTAYDVALGDDEIFWIEQSFDGDTPVRSIRAAEK